MKSIASILTLILVFINAKANSILIYPGVTQVVFNASLTLGSTQTTYNVMQANLGAGDTLYLASGVRSSLRIDNFKGDSTHPIVVANFGSRTVIEQPVNGYYGLAFNACRYIKLVGIGNALDNYGIEVRNLPSGSGISINNFSSNVEITGCEVHHVFSSGIVAKTDPNCANLAVYKDFIMYDIKIHHNYIHHVGNEGLYIGNTGYNDGRGMNIVCSGIANKVMPHRIAQVNIYENIIDSCGWDGIQVSAADYFMIKNNFVTNDSWADYPNQQSGIMIGQPSVGFIVNNTIMNGFGTGIQSFGVGNTIANNLIINAGCSPSSRGFYNSNGILTNARFTYGIYINDKVCLDANVPRLANTVAHNTIVLSGSYPLGLPYNTWAPQGINLNAMNYITGNIIANNLVVIDTNFAWIHPNPVSLISSSNGVSNYSITNNAQFVSSNFRTSNLGNFVSNEINNVSFVNFSQNNFQLTAVSNAVNSGLQSLVQQIQVLQNDKNNIIRPQASLPDFGCFEYVAPSNAINQNLVSVWPNPAAFNALVQVNCNLSTGEGNLQVRLVSSINNASYTLHNGAINSTNFAENLSLLNIPSGFYSLQVWINNQLYAYSNLLITP